MFDCSNFDFVYFAVCLTSTYRCPLFRSFESNVISSCRKGEVPASADVTRWAWNITALSSRWARSRTVVLSLYNDSWYENSALFNFLGTSKQSNYFCIRWTRPAAFVFHSVDLVSVMYIRVVVRVRRGIDSRWSFWHVCRSHSCLIFEIDRMLALFRLFFLSCRSACES